MRVFGRLVFAAILGSTLLGCGKSDNSAVQTPNDQAIGVPGPIGGKDKGGAKRNTIPLKP